MLKKLSIRNYAIIEFIDVDFQEGFTTLTGETGAGKSIILGALNLILGNRFDYTDINNNSLKCVVEGCFNITQLKLHNFFIKHDIDYDDELLIRREFSANGKSRTFINDSPAKLDIVKLLGFKLVDIHSQHENLLIYNNNFQVDLIDTFANNTFPEFQDVLNEYLVRFKKFNALELDLSKSQLELNSSIENLDANKKLISHINSLELVGLNKDNLENDYKKLNNSYEIKSSISEALSLFESDNSLLSRLNSIISKLSLLSDYDVEIAKLVNRLKENYIDINDVCADFHSFSDKLVYESTSLDIIKDKLNAINSLEQDLNLSGVDQILDYCQSLEKKNKLFNSSEEAVESLKIFLLIEKKDLLRLAKKISNYRNKASLLLVDSLKEDLSNLGMNYTTLLFNFSSLNDLSYNGIDCIDLLFSANNGQDLKPLVNIASGGEIARLMLCIKKHLFSVANTKTVIFDEIDSGVSGEIGFKMGKILKSMSLSNQIICITHLPQIASLGLNHYQVIKKSDSLTTTTNIIKLSIGKRVKEIARMLSGEIINKEAIANAKKMLDI